MSGQFEVRAWRERTPGLQPASPRRPRRRNCRRPYGVLKAEGDGAMQAWIDHLPEWQTAHARRVDAVVTRQVKNVYKAVKWHEVW